MSAGNDGLKPEERLVEQWVDDLHRETREVLEAPYERRRLGRLAARIAEDRYNAGSTAAQITPILALRDGPRTANSFVEDLRHHESLRFHLKKN